MNDTVLKCRFAVPHTRGVRSWLTRLSASLLLTGVAGAATTDLTGASPWTTLLTGAAFDGGQDPQAKGGIDLIGDANHAVMYMNYDRAAGTLAFRVRYDGTFSDVIMVGIDANRDGKVDAFVTLNGQANPGAVELLRTGTAANTSPSTSDFVTEKSYPLTSANYSIALVSAQNDPDAAIGGVNTNIDADKELDKFASFLIPFADLQNLLAAKGISVTPSTPMNFVLATSTNGNNINSDIAGTPDGNPTWTTVDSPPISPDAPPVVSSVAFTVLEESVGTPLGLSAPTDANGDTLEITVKALPILGTVTLSGGTAVRVGDTLSAAQLTGLKYTAPLDLAASQAVEFVYTVRDASSAVDGRAAITVQPVNDPPAAGDDASSATEAGGVNNGTPGANATGNVLSNDTDPDTPRSSLRVAAVRTGSLEGSGTAGTVGTALNGTYGSLTLNADGTYTYVVNNTHSAVQALTASQSLTDAFNYTVSDGSRTDTGVLTITINGANDAPTAVTDAYRVAEDSGATTLNVKVNDKDPEGDALTVTAVTQPSRGTVTLSGGVVTYQPAADYNGPDSFTYRVSDGKLESTATVSLTVTPVNDPPVAASGTLTVQEGQTASLGVTAPTDVDGDALTIRVRDLPSAGQVTLSDGTTPVSAGQLLSVGELTTLKYVASASAAPVTFSYTVSDGALSGQGAYTITVTRIPLTVSAPDNTTDNTPLVTGRADAAPGSAVTLVVVQGTKTFTFSATVQADGTYRAESPQIVMAGPYTVTARVTDPNGVAREARDPGSVAPPDPVLNKYVRLLPDGAFGVSSTGRPGDKVQYCITFENRGSDAFNFKLTDFLPSNTQNIANLVYVSPKPATDLQNTTVTPTAMRQPWPAGVTYTQGTFSIQVRNAQNQIVIQTGYGVQLDLGAAGLAAGASGVICFDAQIR